MKKYTLTKEYWDIVRLYSENYVNIKIVYSNFYENILKRVQKENYKKPGCISCLSYEYLINRYDLINENMMSENEFLMEDEIFNQLSILSKQRIYIIKKFKNIKNKKHKKGKKYVRKNK